MRLLLALPNLYTDPTIGAARSLRTLMQWLTEAGHRCEVLCMARLEVERSFDLSSHLAALGVPIVTLPPTTRPLQTDGMTVHVRTGCPAAQFALNGVPVTMLQTVHNDYRQPDRTESTQMMQLLDAALSRFQPDLLLTYGNHFLTIEFMKRAKQRGIPTVLTLRSSGYEYPEWFTHADHVLTTSPFLSRHYDAAIGIRSTGIPSPILHADTLAPTDTRAFVTFVNPSLHKGAAFFARLADTLGRRRPDIPILVIQSAADARILNSIPGINFAQYPQIMAAPSVPQPADFFALTRILLVPSLFAEPFGRVAAEALLNGIPPIVSNRGGLPETVAEGGYVLPLPDWMDETTRQLPSEAEVLPWFETVCRLWDDPDEYARAGERARAVAERLYAEETLRRQYTGYFESLILNKTH
jgi:glycosyltransferase involved in cell wall biosynthesis